MIKDKKYLVIANLAITTVVLILHAKGVINIDLKMIMDEMPWFLWLPVISVFLFIIDKDFDYEICNVIIQGFSSFVLFFNTLISYIIIRHF